MKYVEFINELIRKKVSKTEKIVIFGQNVAAGSYLSGLTKNIKATKNCFVINTPNCENTLCGVGFGLMMGGVSSIFFMKQLDFLLLGIDQLVNTYNFIRMKDQNASFTVVPVIVDNGYQGVQSSFNALGDFSSISRIPCFTVTNKFDSENIINSYLISPGFRIIGLSQRLFGQEILDAGGFYFNNEKTVFQYKTGENVTIVCFNLSFPYGLELSKKIEEGGKKASLFSINSPTATAWKKVIEDCSKTQKIIVIDDSKSENVSLYQFLDDLSGKVNLKKKIILSRKFSADWFRPNPDILDVNYENILKEI
jgi:pyruvate dehydrogenase E1 component beta subunit